MGKFLLISRIDREDGWVCDGMILPVSDHVPDNYEDTVKWAIEVYGPEKFTDRILTTEVLKEVVDDNVAYEVTFVGYRNWGFEIEIAIENGAEFILHRQLDFVESF
jgi:hypothetical protein